jgi:hypothetical protein
MAALLEKDRNRIYNEFRKILGEEATQAMLSQFPAREVEEPATRADLGVLTAELRVEISELGSKLTGRMIALAGIGLAYLTFVLAIFR